MSYSWSIDTDDATKEDEAPMFKSHTAFLLPAPPGMMEKKEASTAPAPAAKRVKSEPIVEEKPAAPLPMVL